MSRRLLLGSVVAIMAVFAGQPAREFLPLGLAKAEARDTYTRKRVNGRWITGVFHKQHAATTPAVAKAVPAAAATAAIASPAAPPPAAPVEARQAPAAEPAATGSLTDYALWLQRSAPERQPGLGDAPQAFFAPLREIRSVVIDYQSGIRTTFYIDGGVTEQPLVGEPIVARSIQSWPYGAPR